MVHLGHDFFQKLNLVNAVRMFLLVIIFFILQYIFDMEFVCSCRPDMLINSIVYFIFPPGILTWVAYITEPFHQARIFSCFQISFFQISFCYKCISFVLELIINYVSLGGLWASSILLDGNWYICLMTNLNSSQTGIPCKKELTHEENQIKTGYRTESLACGLGLICILITVWSIAESITACCKRKTTWKRGCCCDNLLPPYYRKVYEGLLEEKVSDHLKEELTKIAATRAKAICQPHLSTIREDERLPNNGGDGGNRANITVLEAWNKISAWDFPFSSNESHVGAERAADDPALEEMDSGSTSSDRPLMT